MDDAKEAMWNVLYPLEYDRPRRDDDEDDRAVMFDIGWDRGVEFVIRWLEELPSRHWVGTEDVLYWWQREVIADG